MYGIEYGSKHGECVGITTNELVDLLWDFVLIAVNGYFVAAEFAIVRSRRTRLEQYIQQGNKIARHAMDVIDKIDAYLSATQLGITLASLGLGWTAQRSITPILVAIFGEVHDIPHRVLGFISAIIAFLLVTFLQIVFGELAPKSLAISRAESWLMVTALPLKGFYRVMYPAIWLLNATARNVLRMAHITASTREIAHSEEELRMLVAQSHESGVIDETERELFNNVFAFADRVAREIMVPRTDMIALFTDQTIEECLEEIQRERHTRFPLCEDDKDHVIGIIHSKDLFSFALQTPKREGSIRSLARKVVSVPEALGIDDVLKVLQKERSSLAIVIDEYGGTAGMVSLEDVIEELVGEIQDEFDEERPPIEEREGYLSVDARMLIEEVNELFGFSLSDEEVDTVGGWVYAQLVDPLKVGIEVEYEGARFEVAETDNLRITRLHVYPPEVPSDDEATDEWKKGQEE